MGSRLWIRMAMGRFKPEKKECMSKHGLVHGLIREWICIIKVKRDLEARLLQINRLFVGWGRLNACVGL